MKDKDINKDIYNKKTNSNKFNYPKIDLILKPMEIKEFNVKLDPNYIPPSNLINMDRIKEDEYCKEYYDTVSTIVKRIYDNSKGNKSELTLYTDNVFSTRDTYFLPFHKLEYYDNIDIWCNYDILCLVNYLIDKGLIVDYEFQTLEIVINEETKVVSKKYETINKELILNGDKKTVSKYSDLFMALTINKFAMLEYLQTKEAMFIDIQYKKAIIESLEPTIKSINAIRGTVGSIYSAVTYIPEGRHR